MSYELAALGAALCWSVTGIISTGPARHLGGIAFTRIRMTIVFVIMLVWLAWHGSFESIPRDQLQVVLWSGLIGIFLGDTALFTSMTRLGPRRTGILFASNAPMTVVIGWFWFGEALSLNEALGCVLVMAGVAIAIGYNQPRSGHRLESLHGSLVAGVALGLFAALCQAVGALMNKPALAAGADPVAITTLRIGIAALALHVANLLPIRVQKVRNPITPRVLALTTLTGMVGMALAMSLLMYAYGAGNAGIAAILSSVSPVLVLPVLWLVTRKPPTAAAWLGALLCVCGTVFILQH